jgi:hypothetical protein
MSSFTDRGPPGDRGRAGRRHGSHCEEAHRGQRQPAGLAPQRGSMPYPTPRRRWHGGAVFIAQRSINSDQLAAHDGGPGYHRQHFAEGDLARQILEAAIGRYDNALGRHVREGAADAGGDRVWRLHRHVREIEYA